jgi:hypothetical protein
MIADWYKMYIQHLDKHKKGSAVTTSISKQSPVSIATCQKLEGFLTI